MIFCKGEKFIMSYSTAKKASVILLSFLMITGCSSLTPGGTGTTPTGFEQTEFAGLKFTKVTDKNVSLLNNVQQSSANTASGTSGATGMAQPVAARESAPLAAPAPNSVSSGVPATDSAVRADIAPASKMAAPSYVGYFPSPGPFEEYVMINFEEATSSGFTGTYIETLTKIVKPIITAWSKDARQTSVNGSTDPSGKNVNVDTQKDIAPVPYYYSPYQWQFTYISVSKKEVYNIFVSSNETLVLRQKWVIKDLNPDEIKIDSNQAIKIVTEKISDKNYKSPDNQEQYKSPNSEILYSIPDKAMWYFYLSQEKEGLIWNVNFNFYNQPNVGIAVPLITSDTAVSSGGSASGSTGTVSPGVSTPARPSVAPQPSTYVWYSGGYARINAKTGDVLSLSRPMKYTETSYPYPYPEPVKTCDAQGNCFIEGSTPAAASAGVATAVAPPKPL